MLHSCYKVHRKKKSEEGLVTVLHRFLGVEWSFEFAIQQSNFRLSNAVEYN